MQILQLILFLASAVALPWAAIALMKGNMRAIGKAILLVAIAVAARYLLWAVWTPEEMWLLWVKTLVIICVFYVVWFVASWKIVDVDAWRSVRPLVSFVAFMAFPVLLSFAFLGTTFSYRGNVSRIVFWGCWTAWGLLRTALISRKMTNLGRVVLAVVAIAMLTFLFTTDAEARLRSYVGRLNDFLRQNVVERWEPIKESTEKIVDAWDALVALDRRAMAKGKVGVRKIVASQKIKEQISKLREDLLTVDSRAVLSSISKLDKRIASSRKDLSDLRQQRGFSPDKAEKLDAKIAEAEAGLAELEAARAEAIATARRDLKEIGLDLPENSPFLTVDLGALIDNAIVAKSIGFVVENLKANMDAAKGDAEAAKRYYGAYIVMLDVQSECFRQYLDKAATGIWRDGVMDVAKNAEAAKKGNEAKAAAEGRSAEEKKAFLHAAATNEKTLKVAQAYLAILKRHEDVVREKLAATEKRHEIALSFWESVDIASAFTARISSDLADFDALLELKMPEIAFFDDVAMAQEFDAITQKLNRE